MGKNIVTLWHILLVVCITIKQTFAMQRNATVLVLGGGISGIAAAKILSDNGINDFLILEGTDRIGGRMRKRTFHNTTIEMGANWIQGEKGNPIEELAERCGLEGKTENRDFVIRNESGFNTTIKGKMRILKHAEDVMNKIRSRRRKFEEEDISVRVGLRLANWLPVKPEEMATEYFEYDFEYAVPPKYVSLRTWIADNGSIHSVKGKQFFVTDSRGYVHIVECLADMFLKPSDSRLRLNTIVNEVKYNDNGVYVTSAKGDVFFAKFALVTFSIGVLKSGLVQFKPQLPPWKIEAIFKLNMVIYTKIYLKFPWKFWDNYEYIFYACKRRGYYTIMQDLEADSRLPKGTNILLVTVTGEESVRLEYQSNEQTQEEIMEVLKNMYGRNIPRPEGIYYPKWGLDRFFFGSWANLPIGISSADYVSLRRPVGRVFFSGEATHELYNGYVHGGYLTGVEEAEKIAHCIQTGLCDS
ncbi:uncharacterized protein [Acropora muricata]|uniref:uncharacterized protein n=1 Tax=Acropora muricata TaxID=159855 RepID=UPI0034E50523